MACDGALNAMLSQDWSLSSCAGDAHVLHACCRWMMPSTLIQDFALAICPATAAARAFVRATTAASVPYAAIMSRAIVSSLGAVVVIAAGT